MKVNINEYVRVKLTDTGREFYKKHCEELYKNFPELMLYHPPKEDHEGWSKWQLWHLMQLFGPIISLGCITPFDTEIEININQQEVNNATSN